MDSIEQVIRALGKAPRHRKPEEVEILLETIRYVKFFHGLSDEMNHYEYKECCSYLSYEEFPKGSFIIRKGEIGDKFYIILQGTVGVLVPGPDGQGEVQVIELADGDSFGELALNEKKPRAASVLCKTGCHLAVLDKTHYERLLGSLVKMKQNKLLSCLRSNSLFAPMSNIFLIKLLYSFNEEKLLRNRVLFRENQRVDRVYLIKDGEFKLTRTVATAKHSATNRSFRHPARKTRVQLAIASQNHLLGGEDLLNSHYTATCVCISPTASVLAIAKSDLLPKLHGADAERLRLDLKKIQGVRKMIMKSAENVRAMAGEQPIKTARSRALQEESLASHSTAKTCRQRKNRIHHRTVVSEIPGCMLNTNTTAMKTSTRRFYQTCCLADDLENSMNKAFRMAKLKHYPFYLAS